MVYAPIDGSMMEVTSEFRADELRTYLLNEGHAEPDVLAALGHWQENYLEQRDPS